MIGKRFGEKNCSSRGMYIRNIADIMPNWKDIRNSYIPPNWDNIRSIADIPKLSEIARSLSGRVEKV